jgi:hypothetical protein
MKPVTYDFDVVTDAPAPKRRAPDATEQPPQADVERRRAAEALAREPRSNVQAAE